MVRRIAGSAAGVALAFALVLQAPPSRVAAQAEDALDVVKVRKNFYMIAGAGGNIGVQIGSDGIVLVNAGTAQASDRVLAELKKLTDLPIRYIINTDADRDFVGGNEKLSKAGFTIFTNALGNTGFVGSMTNGGAAAILAHESVLGRMTKENYPAAATPTEAFYAPRKPLRMNDEGIEVLYQPNAHSGADSFVLFRASDVVVTGDVMDTTRFPVIDVANGGSINGEIKALNDILNRTNYEHEGEGGTYVVPGHGFLADEHEVVEYRDMAVIVRDRVKAMIEGGATLAQVKAARITADYDTRYGANTGPWTTDMFVEAVYNSLKPAPKTN